MYRRWKMWRPLPERAAVTSCPIYREVLADLETPVSAFLKVKRGEYSFLLESVEGGERPARYSFIGTEPYRVLRTSPTPAPDAAAASDADDPLDEIKRELDRFRLVPNPELPPISRRRRGISVV